MATVSASITDVIDVSDVPAQRIPAEIDETFRVPDFMVGVRGLAVSLTDGIGMSPTQLAQLGVLVAERLQVGDPAAANWVGSLSLSDSIFLQDAMARGLPTTLTDGIGMNFATAAAQVVNIAEALGLGDIISSAFHYNLSVTEKLGFADSLARFIGAGVTEALQFIETAAGSAQRFVTLAEAIGVHEDITSSRLVLRTVVSEGIDISDAELVKMIFSGVIQEGLDVSGGIFEPSGAVSTWAMNTRTHAVTEYTNYDFNSFARFGDRYLGASKLGLYDLSGDTDDGADIIAQIKSGLAQFAGVHLSSFKGAYIAARGNGSWVLKIHTGQGDEYHFAVTNDSMKTARIDMGKGIRARYFAFELISAGQDFDLDSLEFIPLIAKRRV